MQNVIEECKRTSLLLCAQYFMHASLQFIAKCLIGMKRYIIQLYSFEFFPHVGVLERERERLKMMTFIKDKKCKIIYTMTRFGPCEIYSNFSPFMSLIDGLHKEGE